MITAFAPSLAIGVQVLKQRAAITNFRSARYPLILYTLYDMSTSANSQEICLSRSYDINRLGIVKEHYDCPSGRYKTCPYCDRF